MKRKYYIPTDIGKIILIGTGGTGSYLAQGLAKIISGHNLDISVLLVDPQDVEEKNCSRQNFWNYEIGQSKAEALATRLNQQYGTQFMYANNLGEDVVEHFHPHGRLIITCVDSVSARKPYRQKGLWLDIGNDLSTGQAILGTGSIDDVLLDNKTNWDKTAIASALPCAYKVSNMGELKDEPSVPSCADNPFTEQSALVNEWAAQAGLTILHQLIVNSQVKTPQIYFDTKTGRMTPAFITKELYQ
jgi:PRTRC genetic system ThiF family protein